MRPGRTFVIAWASSLIATLIQMRARRIEREMDRLLLDHERHYSDEWYNRARREMHERIDAEHDAMVWRMLAMVLLGITIVTIVISVMTRVS